MSTINFNDAAYAQRGLKAFSAMMTKLGVFSTDFSDAAAQKGNAVYVPRYDALSATTFAYANNSNFAYEGSGGTINVITVNLNNHHIVPLDITDIQAVNSSAAVGDRFADLQGRELGKRALQTIWSQVTTGTYGAAIVTAAVSSWGRTAIRAMRLQLAKNNANMTKASLVANEDIYDAILGDTGIQQAYAYGGSEAIRKGEVPEVLGVQMQHSNLLPYNGISLGAFICVPDALAVASRYLAPQDPGSYDAAFAVTDPESGLTIGYRRHFSPGRGTLYINMECLFGYSVGISTGLLIATIP